MDRVDQSGIDNRDNPAGEPQETSLGAAAAAGLLGVQRATLYSYASKGWIRTVREPGTRSKRYLREDLDRLRVRQRARSGHGPVAAAALAWGDAVLESALTEIRPDGPAYRGHASVALAQAGHRFEAVAELLWQGQLPAAPPAWEIPPGEVGPAGAPLIRLGHALFALALGDPSRHRASDEAEQARARKLLQGFATALGGLGEGAVAERLARGWGASTRERVGALDAALTLCADHELNPSSFAARVAAAAGSDLYACLGAALATASGWRHGGACDRTEALLEEALRLPEPARVVPLRLARGEDVPGFGHPLYPTGDPRGRWLLERARALAPGHPAVRAAGAVAKAMADRGDPPPAVDLGLCALARGLGWPAGAPLAIFALGRAAGWVAHALEQRGSGQMVRPRARYVGPGGPGARGTILD